MTNIQEKLDRYWDGESTLEEEKSLKEYFLSENVLEEHLIFKDLFVYYKDAAENSFAGDLEIPAKLKKSSKINVVTITRRIISVAAIFTLFVASVFIIRNEMTKSKQQSYTYEIEDPDEALEVTLKALALVSGKLDQGTNTMLNGIQNIEKADIIR